MLRMVDVDVERRESLQHIALAAMPTGASSTQCRIQVVYGHLNMISIHYNFIIIAHICELIVKWLISVQNYEVIVKYNYSQMAL